MFETNELGSYLSPNERVLWQGQGKRRMSSSANRVLYAIVAGAALVFVLTLISSFSISGQLRVSMVSLLPLLMILIIGLSVGIPLGAVNNRASRARYFVTTTSAVILYPPTAWSGRRLTVLPLKNLAQITLSENRDGTGSLTFGQSLYSGYGRYSNSWMLDSIPAFSNIEQPQDVYQLIRKQMAEA